MGTSGSLKDARNYEQRLAVHARRRAAFLEMPRCAAPVLGSLALALTLAPCPAIATWAITWLVLSLLVRLAPGLCSRSQWKSLIPLVFALNALPVRWFLVADGVTLALLHGAPLISSLASGAAWITVDALHAFAPHRTRSRPG